MGQRRAAFAPAPPPDHGPFFHGPTEVGSSAWGFTDLDTAYRGVNSYYFGRVRVVEYWWLGFRTFQVEGGIYRVSVDVAGRAARGADVAEIIEDEGSLLDTVAVQLDATFFAQRSDGTTCLSSSLTATDSDGLLSLARKDFPSPAGVPRTPKFVEAIFAPTASGYTQYSASVTYTSASGGC